LAIIKILTVSIANFQPIVLFYHPNIKENIQFLPKLKNEQDVNHQKPALLPPKTVGPNLMTVFVPLCGFTQSYGTKATW